MERAWLVHRSCDRRKSCRIAERRISSSKPLVAVTDIVHGLLYHCEGVLLATSDCLWKCVCFDEGSELLVLGHLVRNRVVFPAFVVPDNIA